MTFIFSSFRSRLINAIQGLVPDITNDIIPGLPDKDITRTGTNNISNGIIVSFLVNSILKVAMWFF